MSDEKRRQVKETVKLFQIPIEQYCKPGELEPCGNGRYRVPSEEHLQRLPDDLQMRIDEIEPQPDGSIIIRFVTSKPGSR